MAPTGFSCVSPNFRAVSMIDGTPALSPTFTATLFFDCQSAWRSVISPPSNLPS
jgi:hypothetical protein